MKLIIRFFLCALVPLCLCHSVAAQTKAVLKGVSTNAITENLVVPSGKTLTINSGGSLVNNGTATGFGGSVSTLTDVTLTSLASGDFLRFNGTAWINRTAANARIDLGLGTAATKDTGTTPNSVALFGASPYNDAKLTFSAGTGSVAIYPQEGTSSNVSVMLPTTTGGVLVTTADTGSVTNAMLAGSIDLSTKVTGTLPTARLGSGTANSSTYLRGDQTWAAASSYVSAEVEVSGHATGGAGTSVDPWTGWDTAITWTAFTRYRFKSGYYRYVTSPNFLLAGIELIGEAGTYFVHAPTTAGTDAFTMDAGATPGTTWVQNVRVENIILTASLTSIASGASLSGTTLTVPDTTLTPAGSYITFRGGTSSAHSYKIASVTNGTTAVVDRTASLAETNTSAKVCLSRNGFFLRGVRNGVFDRLAVHDMGNACIWTEACVTNSLRMFRATYHEPAQSTQFLSRPQYGIVTAGRGGDWSTCWNIEEPVIEGMMVAGIKFSPASYGNTVINGTSEGHPYESVGVLVQSNNHTFMGIDVEANTSDICFQIEGSYNTLINCLTDGTIKFDVNNGISPVGAGSNNVLINSTAQQLSFLNSVYLNRQYGGSYTNVTDNGNLTIKVLADPANLDFRSYLGVVNKSVVTDLSVPFTPNTKLYNSFNVAVTSSATVGAPTAATMNQEFDIFFYSYGDYTISWNAAFDVDGVNGMIPPSVITNGAAIYAKFCYNATLSKWICTATSNIPLTLDAAASLQMGVDSSTATAQTIHAHDGLGTDKAGADFKMNGGRNTGAGTPGNLVFQTGTAGGSGSSLSAYTTRLTIAPAGITSTIPLTVQGGSNSWRQVGSSGVMDWYNNSVGYLFRVNGSDPVLSSGAAVQVGAAGTFVWQSANNIDSGSIDLILARDSAAVLQLGIDASTETSQGIKAHDGSGTDKDGADLNLGGGQSTGTGRGGDVAVHTALSGSTGSSANSYSTRAYYAARPVTLTESSATTIATIGVASSKFVGLRMICTVTANDGTDYQSLTSEVTVDAVNKAGTVTSTIQDTPNSGGQSASAGTLTCTYTAVASGSTVLIKANAVSSLTQTTLTAKWSILSLNSDGSDTTIRTGSLVTPQ